MKFLKIFTIIAVLGVGAFAQSRPTNIKSTNKPLVTKTVSSSAIGYRTFSSTAYCLTGKTASGVQARRGIIAVDPRVIKLGSKVHILGLGTFLAGDKGGKIKGAIIDLHMSCKEAIRWGRRKVQLKIM